MTNNEALKPCKCGGLAKPFYDASIGCFGYWYVYCESCKEKGPLKKLKENAIAAWNKRVMEDNQCMK
jgi:hypothetical protein